MQVSNLSLFSKHFHLLISILKFSMYNLLSFRKCRVKRRNARRNKNINILNTEFKRTAKINNLEVAQVSVGSLLFSFITLALSYHF